MGKINSDVRMIALFTLVTTSLQVLSGSPARRSRVLLNMSTPCHQLLPRPPHPRTSLPLASASSSLGSTAIRGPGAPAVPSGSPAGTVASKARAGPWGGRGSGRPLSCFLLRKACWLRRAQASVRTAPSGLGSLFIVFKNQSRK